MSKGRCIDDPPPVEQRIEALHVCEIEVDLRGIATYANGSEGIVSADLPVPGETTPRHMPLMSSKRDVAEKLQRLARSVTAAALHQTGRVVTLRLVTFPRQDQP